MKTKQIIINALLKDQVAQAYSDLYTYGGAVMKNGRVIPMEDYIKETGTVEDNKILDTIKLYKSKPFTKEN